MRRGSFQRGFYLGLAFAFSLCLTTPLLEGLGYSSPGFFPRALLILGFLLFYSLIHACPWLAAVLPAALLTAAVLLHRYAPNVLLRLYTRAEAYLVDNYLFWPLVILLAAALFMYLLFFKLQKPSLPLLLAAGLAAFVPLWYLHVDSAYPAAVFYMLGWFLLLGYRRGEDFWSGLRFQEAGDVFGPGTWKKKRGEVEPDGEKLGELRLSWMRHTAAILFTALFLSLLLPKNLDPLPLPALQDRIAQAFPLLYDLRGGEELGVRGDGEAFSLYSSGFQTTSRLGGPLLQDPALLLEVRGRGGIYLKGSVKDAYAGRTWTNTKEPEALAEFPQPSPALKDYLLAVDLRIVHRRLRTLTVFTPGYLRNISEIQPLRADANSNITLPEEVSRGREYRVRGYIIGYLGDFAALEEPEELSPEFASYLALPPDLPPRVTGLAEEIAGEYPGNYQKMKALEGYLRAAYRYTTETPPLPEGRDFVEHFLFELKEGYCSYFASALAVMGRALGVPTRYVEGFKVPEELDSGRFYPVAGTSAHAWVEAYIPGLGWLPFEATPAYTTADALPPPPVEPPGGDNGFPDTTFPLEPDPGAPPFVGPSPDDPGPRPPVPGESSRGALFLRLLAPLLGTAAMALLLVLLGRFARLRRALKELGELPPARRAAGYYILTLSLLERLGEGKGPGETPREYSRRIIHRVHTWGFNFTEISEGMNLVLYSGREEAPAGLAAGAEGFYRFIFDRYLHKVGKWGAFSEILLQGKYFSRLQG